jgi:CrcB protein
VNFTDLVWVGLGGSAGAVARFVVDGIIRSRVRTRIPAGTVTINVTGSLLLGVLTGLVLFRGAPSMLTTVAGTGFCGGYTTFSTASFETVRLVQQRAFTAAVANGAITLLGAVGAGAVGLALTRI